MKPGAEKRIQDKARWLYRAMPGAPVVREDAEGNRYWGEVDGNDHYRFCDRIARLIESVDTRTHVDPD